MGASIPPPTPGDPLETPVQPVAVDVPPPTEATAVDGGVLDTRMSLFESQLRPLVEQFNKGIEGLVGAFSQREPMHLAPLLLREHVGALQTVWVRLNSIKDAESIDYSQLQEDLSTLLRIIEAIGTIRAGGSAVREDPRNLGNILQAFIHVAKCIDEISGLSSRQDTNVQGAIQSKFGACSQVLNRLKQTLQTKGQLIFGVKRKAEDYIGGR